MLKGFLVLFSWGLLGKVAAIGRELVFAAAFGTGATANAFRVAQTATFVPVSLMTGDLLTSAFVPRYAKLRATNRTLARELFWTYLLLVSVLSLLAAALLTAFADELVRLIAPGLGLEASSIAIDLLRILAWSAPLLAISALLNYALAAAGKYALVSIRATIQSVGLVAGTAMAVVLSEPTWLAWGFTGAWAVYGVASVIVTWFTGEVGRVGFSRRIAADWTRDALRTLKPLWPLPVLLQGSIVLERVIASLVSTEAVAVVDYAKVVSESVVGLVAVPLGLIGLTQLPTRSSEEQIAIIRRFSMLVLTVIMPLSTLVVLGAPAIVGLLYGYGDMGDGSRAAVAAVLTGLGIGLWAQVLGYGLTRALIAQGRNGAVFVCMAIALVCQIGVQSLSLIDGSYITLGLGPSAYGVALVVGTLFVLRMPDVLKFSAFLAMISLGLVALVIGVLGRGGVAPIALLVLLWLVVLVGLPSTRAPIYSFALRLRPKSGTEDADKVSGPGASV